MTLPRREFLALTGAFAVPVAFLRAGLNVAESGAPMFGVIGKITAVTGQRDALAAILLEGTRAMPGCLSYVVANDPVEPDALWITEVWDRQKNHQASLELPAVREAMMKGRPLITGFSNRVETVPLGGHGLQPSASS